MNFQILKPAEACTAIERWVETGFLRKDEAGDLVFTAGSMNESTARILLGADHLRNKLPEIRRVASVQIPILVNGQLVLPKSGFDDTIKTYTDPRAPKIITMDPVEAKRWLHEVFRDFPFASEQSLVHAVARLLTPLCRGIMDWSARGPFWAFVANRERSGKDYLAGITSILYEGACNEDAPLEPRNTGETRKRITSAVMSGRRLMHFGNCRGHINDPALEQAITAKTWSDRVLGGNTEVTLPNELEFSMSGNVGITYTADIAHRSRIIGLVYNGEDPNKRQFTRPNLHRWVYEHRSDILSAIYALICHWHSRGAKVGPTPFASFPEWAQVVGGIMHESGLGDPCLPEATAAIVGGDEETAHMRHLFSVAHEKFGSERVELCRIVSMIQEDDDSDSLFPWLDLAERGGRTAFGKLLRRFVNRNLGGIVLRIHDAEKRRPRFSFEQHEEDGSPTDKNPVRDMFGHFAPAGGAPADGVGNVGDIVDIRNPYVGDKIIPEDKSERGDIILSHMKDGVNVDKIANVDTLSELVVVTEPAALSPIAELIRTVGLPVALDIETYGKNALDPFLGEIRLLSLAIPGHPAYLIDLRAVGYDLGPLQPVLEGCPLIGHNLRFDALWLLIKCGLRLEKLFCTLTAARLLTAGTDVQNGLGECLERYLSVKPPKDQARSDWGACSLSQAQLRYAKDDVSHLHALRAELEKFLSENGLLGVFQTEMSLLPVVVQAEAAGFAVDREKLLDLKNRAEGELENALQEIRRLSGSTALNPASPAQVLKALREVGLQANDTSAETLASLTHPLVEALEAYRAAQKRAQQAEKLLDALRSGGRIHAQFNPTGTDTGRFSSSRPNLQNVPRQDFRFCFVPPPGHRLVVADYSQIELRAAAAIAGEEEMLRAYRDRVDLHQQTASLVLNKPLSEVSKQDRQLAKAVNFGLLYGQSAKGLMRYAKTNYGVDLTLQLADRLHRNFFSAYPALRKWHDQARRAARSGASEVRTRTGRRRLLPNGSEKEWQRFTALVNMPVQGGCADGLKRAMIEIAGRLGDMGRIVSTVHDEIVVEAREEQADNVRQLVTECMRNAMSRLFPEVPIEVEANVCQSWGDK